MVGAGLPSAMQVRLNGSPRDTTVSIGAVVIIGTGEGRGGEGERGRGGEEERGRGGEGGERLMLHLASFQPCPRMELVAKSSTEMKALLAYLPTRQELGTSTL